MLLKADSKTPLADAFKRKVFNDRRNINILVVGKTQTRKSTAAIALARSISPRFTFKKHLAILEAKALLKIFKESVLFRGDVVIADDFGVGINHRAWHSFFNKALNYSMMTHGFRGFIVIVTVPYESYIDSDTRLLFDYKITTLSKNDSERYVKIKVEELQHVQIKKNLTQTYKHFPRMKYADGTIKMIRSFRIGYPPNDVMNEYFSFANEAKKKLQHELSAESEEMEKEKTKRLFALDFYIEEIMKDTEKFKKVWQHRPFLDTHVIMNEFNLGKGRADRVKSATEKKLGWDSETRVD